MYELIQAKGGSYYMESPAKVGLVQLGGDRVCLIDSGSDKDAGRKVRQHLDAKGWHLTAIYNTHSNADHIGGNQYLQKQTGCAIYAPGMSSASPAIRCWSRRCCTAAARPRLCGTSFLWRRRAKHSL